ncbi:lipid A deacylase LpxR family protein [Magnetospirillum moscoviense]|uniref:lipid A deacylase LpxR family protein n=1 Tax=Magnetospirillum moscoviense TaxID=1437059 RepID=UPI000838496E|nr:lipid A deacylase LpxR family protein [Magnetospirillum moscoviense]
MSSFDLRRSPPSRKGIVACGLLLSLCGPALAEDSPRMGVLEENDSLYTGSDRHYTQGLRISLLTGAIKADSPWAEPFALIAPPDSGQAVSRRYSVFVGQSLFTPEDVSRKSPDGRDRPYAGWLYLGTSLLQESAGNSLENLELSVGIVGPGAMGRSSQNDYHQFIGIKQAWGWGEELDNEPGIVLSYERLWRFALLGGPGGGVDVVPQAGATIGNVFTYASAGAMLRWGRNLQVDYGGARVRPGLSGTDYFDGARLDGKLGYSVFAGLQGRLVAHNIFLDGSLVQDGPGVDKMPVVADFQAGLSLFWSRDVQMMLGAVRRTSEFEGQDKADVIGVASISFSL